MAPDANHDRDLDDNGNGERSLFSWLRKYQLLLLTIIATAGSCTAMKVCVNEIAPVMGVQTVAASKGYQAANSTEHENIVGSISAMEERHEKHREEVVQKLKQTDDAVLELLEVVSPKRAKKVRAKRAP